MITFEPKISGTRIEGWICDKMLFSSQIITLKECLEKVHRQETMDWLLDTLRFSLTERGEWFAIIDHDSIMKLSILEYSPEDEKELVEYFGKGWVNQYIRFNH